MVLTVAEQTELAELDRLAGGSKLSVAEQQELAELDRLAGDVPETQRSQFDTGFLSERIPLKQGEQLPLSQRPLNNLLIEIGTKLP